VPPSLPGFFSFRPLLTNEGTVGWQSTIEPCRGYRWFLFATSALTGIGLFFIPAFIIRPFHHRTASALSLAMALRQRAPWPTLAAALLCLLVALVLWSTASISRKIILAAAHSRNAATSKAFPQFWRSLSSAPVSGAFDGTHDSIARPVFERWSGSALLTFPKPCARVDYGERQLEMTAVILAVGRPGK